ncbi:FxSxx-COOH cyclophane-containing RiPP peptide [Thermomonospora amylolytica]|uniref:FxSxx-COOH cyclophane-containing RiPP peptide n=1 Tax=Thermomonospora amylolytica TaxID=1411117 RepID=UPI000E6C35B8|nr:FxSxx-COOH cyclophane-containing RiPP peptide [Thermomonospora amylolytica]
MGDADGAVESELIRLSELSLSEIRSLDGTVLGEALRRIRAESEGGYEAVARFDSALHGPAR